MPAAPTAQTLPPSPAGAAPTSATSAGGSGLDAMLFGEANRVRANGAIPESPNAPYVFKHHANHWEFVLDEDGEGEWLPVLTTFHVAPGVGGTRVVRGRYDTRISKGRMEASGYRLIPSDEVVVKARTITGQPYYHDVFATPHVIGRSVNWSYDMAAWNVWRASLVASGYLPPPVQVALDFHIRVQDRLTRRLSQNAHQPAIHTRLRTEARKLERMREVRADQVLERLQRRAETSSAPTPTTEDAAHG